MHPTIVQIPMITVGESHVICAKMIARIEVSHMRLATENVGKELPLAIGLS
jgi:hypothetical protein